MSDTCPPGEIFPRVIFSGLEGWGGAECVCVSVGWGGGGVGGGY